jgi:hypothetical protein
LTAIGLPDKREILMSLIRKDATMKHTISGILFLILLSGCTSIQRLDPTLAERYEGFICDSKTTKSEVQGRLGFAHSEYENGRILIYHVFLNEDGHMDIEGTGTCHACVLVFDENNVLERHSLVKHGCQ